LGRRCHGECCLLRDEPEKNDRAGSVYKSLFIDIHVISPFKTYDVHGRSLFKKDLKGTHISAGLSGALRFSAGL
jgi:hypothetical protein